jgi:hypothetical protein
MKGRVAGAGSRLVVRLEVWTKHRRGGSRKRRRIKEEEEDRVRWLIGVEGEERGEAEES